MLPAIIVTCGDDGCRLPAYERARVVTGDLICGLPDARIPRQETLAMLRLGLVVVELVEQQQRGASCFLPRR